MAALKGLRLPYSVIPLVRRLHRIPLPAIGLAGISTLVVLNLIPASQPFEGVLEASSVSFRIPSKGTNEAIALTMLNAQVSNLTLEPFNETGAVFPLELGGTILGASQQGAPVPPVEALSVVRIQLADGVLMRLGTPVTTSLGLRLVLPPGSRVDELGYDQRTSTIGLGILPPEGSGATLELTPPPDPLEVVLTSARALTNLSLSSSGPLRFGLLTSEFTVPITRPVRLRLRLTAPPGIDLFPQGLPVTGVRFVEETRSRFGEVPSPRSSLRGGTLHLGMQEDLSLRPDQYLTIQPPGIKEFSFLRLMLPEADRTPPNPAVAATNLGQAPLAIGVVGSSRSLASGLSQKHPSSFRRGSVLSGLLTPNQLAAVNGFLGGIASALVLTLFKKG